MITFLLPATIILIAISLIFLIVLPYKKVHSYRQEGVTTYFFPILGFFKYILETQSTKGDVMANMKQSNKNAPEPKYLASHINMTPFIFLQSPQYIKEHLQKANLYVKGPVADSLKLLAANGLVGAEGETWKRHRKIISSSFNFEFLKTNIPVIQNTTREFFEKVTADDCKNYSVISRAQDITGEIVGRIFFGEHLNTYTVEGKSLTVALADIASELAQRGRDPLVALFGAKVIKVPFIPQYRRLMRGVRNIRRVCFDIIKDRKSKSQSQPTTPDLLSSLLTTQSCPDPEQRFSDEDIVDEFITFFTAGMDTTGHLIGMTIYNLHKYPEYLEKLQAERDHTYNLGEKLTTETLSKMDVLHSILKETLRFYTPAPLTFLRKAVCDHELLDLKVKKGDLLSVAFLAPALDERHFENPKQFNPARWKNGDSKVDPYAFTPLSAGPRNCIGQHLAMMEAKIIVSEFLERFEFSLDEEYKLKMILRFLYEPEDELLFTLRSRTVEKTH